MKAATHYDRLHWVCSSPVAALCADATPLMLGVCRSRSWAYLEVDAIEFVKDTPPAA